MRARASWILVASLTYGLALAAAANEPPPTAEAIMAKVAANQDRAEGLRTEYVYRQHIHIVSQKANGTKMREESADYLVTPTPDGTTRRLTAISGHYREKKAYVEFSGEPVPGSDTLDGDMVHDFRQDLIDDKSKDGFAKHYFPLTSAEEAKHTFRLVAEETEQGRRVYRISFKPKDRDEFTWGGEAMIDAVDFQPIRVYTKLSHPLPFLVRKFLADLPGFGFNIQYRRQEDGVWFPASLGAEFQIHFLMFWARTVSISLENTGFERTHVEHHITYPIPDSATAPPDPGNDCFEW